MNIYNIDGLIVTNGSERDLMFISVVVLVYIQFPSISRAVLATRSLFIQNACKDKSESLVACMISTF